MKALGVLAGGIVHEINTPTQFVGANLEFIEKAVDSLIGILEKSEQVIKSRDDEQLKARLSDLTAALNDERYSYFKDQLQQTVNESMDGMERIKCMVKSMKSFMHNGEHQHIFYHINQIITDAVNLSRNEWKYIARMNLVLGEQIPTLSCCPQELCQAFLNIIINAAHAIAARNNKDDHSVRGDIEIHTCCTQGAIEIRVADNGVGISDEAREHIFEPFFTTKTIGEGSGLGLSISYNIISKHGGTIAFDSRPNEGTVFKVSLPVQKSEDSAVKSNVA